MCERKAQLNQGTDQKSCSSRLTSTFTHMKKECRTDCLRCSASKKKRLSKQVNRESEKDRFHRLCLLVHVLKINAERVDSIKWHFSSPTATNACVCVWMCMWLFDVWRQNEETMKERTLPCGESIERKQLSSINITFIQKRDKHVEDENNEKTCMNLEYIRQNLHLSYNWMIRLIAVKCEIHFLLLSLSRAHIHMLPSPLRPRVKVSIISHYIVDFIFDDEHKSMSKPEPFFLLTHVLTDKKERERNRDRLSRPYQRRWRVHVPAPLVDN